MRHLPGATSKGTRVIGSSNQSPLLVEDVVTALTGEVAPGPSARAALRERMQRATQEFDERTAEAFARMLFQSLSENPTDMRQLEALVILGLAHPRVLDRHRISLDKEGERLLFLLERAGEMERAESLSELLADRLVVEEFAVGASAPATKIDPAERIERYLRKADEASAAGRTREAIACLEEVRALDPGRRDVLRIIRDLRSRRRVRRWRLLHGLKYCVVITLVGLAVYGVWHREQAVRHAYAALPPLAGEDLPALRARIGAIDAFLDEELAWFGMASALQERNGLQHRARLLQVQSDSVVRDSKLMLQDRTVEAEAARTRGLMYARQERFAEAEADLRLALELAPPKWEHRKQVEVDLKAIRTYVNERVPAEEPSR